MSKLLSIARNECRRHTAKRSFLFALFGVPAVFAVVVGVSALTSALSGSDVPDNVGVVDLAGALPAPLPPAGGDVVWAPFSTEEAAQAALEAGGISAYYLLPASYGQTLEVEIVTRDGPSGDVVRGFRHLLRTALLAGQPDEVVQRALDGSLLVVRTPDGRREFAGSPTLGQLVPALAGFAIVVLIFFGSGYLLGAVVDEKENRTMEVLMTSVSPGQLMAGKVLGIVVLTLSLFAAWIVIIGATIYVGGDALGLAWLQDVRVDAGALLVTVALLIPSFVLAAALMAALGATLAEAQTGQQITAMLISFYLMPLMGILPLLQDLDSPLLVGLSIFPLTSPVILPLRYALSQVPAWQIGASVAVQSICALGALWLAGRAFRLGALRYGRRLKLRELFGGAAPPPAQTAGIVPQPTRREGERTTAGSKTLLVARRELVTVLRKPLFLLSVIGVPLILFFQLTLSEIAFGNASLSLDGLAGTGEAESAQQESAAGMETQGYVDPGGLVPTIPAPIPPGTLVDYASEEAARRALDEGEIDGYYLVPADYAGTGELVWVRPDHNPLAPASGSDPMEWALLVNLLGQDAGLAARVWNPMTLHVTTWTAAAGATAEEDDDFANFLYPMLIAMVIYGVVVMSSGLVLNSVSDEKKNRVMEVLLLSASPRQLLAGKIAGLSVAGLVQALIWLGMGSLFFSLGGSAFGMSLDLDLPLSVVVWGIIYFLLGYGLYASLMAAAGALVPNVKESPMVSLMIVLPAVVGFMVSEFTMNAPHSLLPTMSSLFPLTAPFSMMSRLVVGGVPAWQPPLAALLMALTAILIVRAVARMFHAQNLLSGQPFSVKRYLRALVWGT